ncbi:hypothetical protein Syn7502_00841 [Synechococcus sp. PCC 7502]|uniref:hypothetical protein n=1 Tax=Synechococcus sp. PCC 7502 TaxID=1173263 RepID=UPI00029F8601|nr:hypothetical protein [Synechococcus sp. PCC 7502]AFY72973.1 hypothetical protein Syn7502_00841 [Synechococcus sp. PCC 7502]
MSDEILTTKEMASKLKVSTDHLLDLCKDGTLQPQIHFIDIRKQSSSKPCYRFKMQACLERFAIPADVRS